MPDAKMTEGERIAYYASATMVNSHGNRLPPSIKRWLANEIDAAIARLRGEMLSLGQELTLDSLSAKDAEIERLRGMLKRLEWSRGLTGECPCCRSARVDTLDRHADNCELAALLKEPTNDHHT